MERSLRFYVDQLGFAIALRWEPGGRLRWCRLERDSVALMLQELVDDRHDPVPLARPFGTGVTICITCADSLALYDEVAARGLAPSGEPFVGNGMWVVDYTDPDGYQIEFSSATDVPEETMPSSGRADRPPS